MLRLYCRCDGFGVRHNFQVFENWRYRLGSPAHTPKLWGMIRKLSVGMALGITNTY